MTILFLARRFYPEIGGVEKHVLEIGKRLVKQGHQVVVITENLQKTHSGGKRSSSSSAKLTGKVNGIEIFSIDVGKANWFKKFRVWRELWRLRGIIKEADIVHCHDVFFWYLPFRFLHPLKSVYTTFHGYEGDALPTKKAIYMHKLAEKLSKGNICVGDFLKKWYRTKPTLVIYGAVEQKLIKIGAKPIRSEKDVMFLGRLEEETGIMEYLKAIKVLKENNINLKLDVFGDGSLKKVAEEFVRENKLQVSFKGFVANATDFIKDYKYVFVSRYLGILEAMAVKKPILAQYNNAIKKDYLRMAPFAKFILIAKDREEIAWNFQSLLKNKLEQNTNKAYDWVKDKTWERLVDSYLRLWGI